MFPITVKSHEIWPLLLLSSHFVRIGRILKTVRPRYQAEFWKRDLHVNCTASLFTVLSSYSIFSVLLVLGGGGTHLLGVKKGGVLVPIRVFIVKRSTAGAFAVLEYEPKKKKK